MRSSGRRAGLWLAPFVVGAGTTLATEHPDWLVGPAGRNWGQPLVGLDLTHPGVRELLAGALRGLVGLGVDYLKLDFLYAGAVPGRRREDVDAVAAYRAGLGLVRDAVGPDVYLVGCGAPLLPSVGLVDAMRVSPDTFHEGGEDGSTGLRGLMPLAARAWQQGRLWVNDPDCVVARPSYSQRERWARAARRLGGLRSFSDRVADLDAWGLATVRDLVADGGRSRALRGRRPRRGRRARPGGGRPVSEPAERLAARIAPYVQLCYPRRPRRGHASSWSRWPRPTRAAAGRASVEPPTHRTGYLITYGDGIRRHGETPLHTLADLPARPRR